MQEPVGPSKGRSVCDRLTDIVWRQGRRELAIANAFSTGIRLAPTLDDKQLLVRHCAEELEHLERAASLYDELGSGDLLEDLAREHVADPRCWNESVIAGVLLDHANLAQLRSHIVSPDPRLSRLALRLIGDEREHVEFGEATLGELLTHGATASELQAHIDAWLPVAVALLDPPVDPVDTSPDPCGVLHVNAPSSGKVVEWFLQGVDRALAPLALRAGTAARALLTTAAQLPASTEDAQHVAREAATHAPALAPIARVLHPETLERLAGSKTFDRGQFYSASGRVACVERRGSCLHASVLGTSAYTVTIWVSGDRLAYACSCPAGVEGECCKHVVAAGLGWLAQQVAHEGRRS